MVPALRTSIELFSYVLYTSIVFLHCSVAISDPVQKKSNGKLSSDNSINFGLLKKGLLIYPGIITLA